MNLAEIRVKATNLFQSGLAQDASWMLISKLFNVIMQAGYFIIVARLLGKENYGSFIVITASASIIFPFIALGSEHVLVKNVATNRASFSMYWGNTLVLLISGGALLTVALLFFSPLIFPQNITWLTTLLILLSDLICLGLLDISYKALVAASMVKKTAQLGILSTCGKLLAALSLSTFFAQPSITTWGYLYFTSSAITAAIAILVVNKMVATPRPVFSELKSNIGQGLYFSISASANNINAGLDKSMLGKLSNVASAGIYGSAYRFIDVGNVPLLALFGASYKRFFQHGASGIKGSFNFAKRLLPMLVFYAIASLIGYWLLAPFIPTILGEEYREAIGALLWLSPLPAIAAFQYLAADTLTGSGHQKARSMVQLGAAVLNIILNIWLIPQFSWKGAAWATLISDSIRLVSLWLIVFLLYRRANR
ncbi:oligosaccharide flippase family protein [Waterburya agarophytonicola K14]|uniref:Oligosaccharide flippase family protein n=1 Tax=Waterburya agarophytonicola KI4 TaxID=2874699 RepID=A0A964FFW2_9CYAN|nr:oligosaccharide flippase family protein [Waterburya agarophytonicola]MCC0177341.1 oligosaccharide flippase family protein [Waterburya agarophytonicola KI4]